MARTERTPNNKIGKLQTAAFLIVPPDRAEILKLLTLKEGLVLTYDVHRRGQPMSLPLQQVTAGAGFLGFPHDLMGIMLGENQYLD
jgi:hypothetical protein